MIPTMTHPHTTPGASMDGKPPLSMYRPYTVEEAQQAAHQLTQELHRIARERAWERLVTS